MEGLGYIRGTLAGLTKKEKKKIQANSRTLNIVEGEILTGGRSASKVE